MGSCEGGAGGGGGDVGSTCFTMLLILLLLFSCHGSWASQDSQVPQKLWVAPYNFSLDSESHQLHTSWEVKGASVSFLCAFADFAMVEIGFTGKEQELNSGNSWAVQCEEQEVGDKMIVEVDITKYRVQPFKSYKVCISLEDPTSGSYLRRVCTHLFSFERAVPYVPTTIKKVEKATSAKLSTQKQSKESENESGVGEESENESDLRRIEEEEEEERGGKSDLQRVLEDTRHFVRDDFSKVERALEEPFFNMGTSATGSAKGLFLALGIVLMLL